MVIGGLTLAAVLGLAFGYFVMMLWNWLMPVIFGLKVITFWKAFGIIVLAKILFGGHGIKGHGLDHNKWRHHGWKAQNRMHYDDWAPRGDYGNWRYYEDYWKNEGKAAFETYLDRVKGQDKQS